MAASKSFITLSIVFALSSGLAASAGGGKDGRAGSWRNSAQGAPEIKTCLKLVEKNPQDAVANNDLGWAYRQNGDLAKAEKYLREAVKLNPQMAQAHSNLSVVLLDGGNAADAQKEAAQATTIDASNPIYRVVLGNALAKAGDRKAAIEQYRTAIKLKPDYENALYNLGRVLNDDGQRNDAKMELSQALLYDPKDDRVVKLLDELSGDTASVSSKTK
jgi:Flp pilus assembly protein TadD